MIKVIDNVIDDIKSEKIKFDAQTNLDFCEFYEDDSIKKYTHTQVSCVLPVANPFFISWVGDSIICCSDTGATYMKTGDVFTYVGRIDASNKIVVSSIIIRGISYPLIVDGKKLAYRISDNTLIELGGLDADYACNNGEILFTAKGRTLTFSAVNDMMDFTFGIDRAGQFDIEDGYGDIVALATENKKLIIFTSHAIFEFCAIGARTDYTLKRIECDYLNVLENSVRDIGDRIIFVSDRKIYYYKSGKVYLEQSFLGDNDCIITNAPALDGKIYYLPISYKGVEFLFRYDLDNKKYNFITAISNDLFDGEYPVYKNISMYKIDKVDVQKTPVYTAKSVLDKTTKKVIVKIIAYVVGSATLTLNGNSGSCKIQLKDGLNEKKIRLSSISFSMHITEQSNNFEILEMQVKYRIKGE